MTDPVVSIEQGKLRGQVCKSDNQDFSYFAFKNIPFAKPPIGELRFCAPQEPEPWQGVRDATKNPNICAQFCKITQTVIGDEDCLYLNLFTPKLPSTQTKLLPVMVFIHGGGFLYGNGTDDSTYGPEFLVDKEVVIVSLNYRVGILGFLSMDRKEAPGNMGLMDQVQALKWVQKNVANFGGDPDNVTIFGISAGGASVGYLMLSPMARGLFHKAIAQSGAPLLHWAINTDVKNLASTIPIIQNKTISDDEQLLNYLKNMPIAELISSSMAAVDQEKFRGGIHFGFVPTIEKPGDWEPFLMHSPYQLLARGDFSKVPYMTGFCTREGLLMLYLATDTLETVLKTNSYIDYFPFDLNDSEKTEIENAIKEIYPEGEKTSKDADAHVIDFFTDVDFLGGVYVAAKLIAKQSNPVYFYEFSYDGKLNYLKRIANIQREGACHGDEGGYVIMGKGLSANITETDAAVRKRITTLWTNFAKYGNPTPEVDDLIESNWEPMTESKAACLVIDNTLKMKYEVSTHRMKLYEDLYENKCGAGGN